MKTIKQLEKEIEEFIKVSDINNPQEEDLFPVLESLKSTLNQTKEIIKMIEEMYGDYKSEGIKKILTKLRGENDRNM